MKTNIPSTRLKQLGLLTMVLLSMCQLTLAKDQSHTDRASLVNPLVGTDRNGDLFPGAVAPFGMMQLSPNWANNGYYYTDTHMHGFVVNLMSGDGGTNEGQVLMTATTGKVAIDRASTDFAFDHQHESAAAGYYQVLMNPWNINAQMTTTTRCGMLKFTFPAGKQANIILPLSYANTPVLSSSVHVVNDHTLSGEVTSQSFGGENKGITVYYAIEFSRPFASHGVWTGTTMANGNGDATQKDRKAPVVGFYSSYPATKSSQVVTLRIGMSYVDKAGAMANLKAEMPPGSFNHYRTLAAHAWNKELSLIDVEGGTLNHNRIFYTALYHALIAPTIFEDVDGRYRGYDDKIHNVPAGHKHLYATFSGWDIYRTEMPLLGIIEPQRAQDMAQSIVEMAKQLGYIDRWPQLNQPTCIMNGDPLTICLTNLWNAGLHDFDMTTAYAAMHKQTLPGNPHSHIHDYQYFDEEKGGVTLNEDDSVSSDLEYDVSFAALGHLALALNKPEDANYLFTRASQYRQMYNPASGFLQWRTMKGQWDRSFGGYTEGNRWIYLWFVPQDVQGLIDLMGGTQTFNHRLDEFFTDNHYDPTNEPDLQSPFLYDYIDRPWKTQHIVAETADKAFSDTPGGLAGGGNDDLGTMSAWYILSQMGFYPVDPGIPDFEVCTPRFSRIIIHLNAPYAGKQFVISTPKASAENEYIQSAVLNGKPLTKPWFAESAITGGGDWNVAVGSQPNKNWAASPSDRPYSLSTGYTHIPAHPILRSLVPTGQKAPVMWQYTTHKPAADWNQSGFDDTAWAKAPAGFGTDDSNVTPRTPWATNDIWMRRTFTLPADSHALAMSAYHDQAITVYINGTLAAKDSDWVHSYTLLAISEAAKAKLHPGENVLAVHVHHSGQSGQGRHFADVGIVDLQWPEAEK